MPDPDATRFGRSTSKGTPSRPPGWRDPIPGDAVEICFGDRCLDGRLVTFSSELNKEPTVTVEVAESVLHGQAYDYAALLRVFRRPRSGNADSEAPRRNGDLLFTGYVERVRGAGEGWQIDGGSMTTWRDLQMGGLFLRVHPSEAFWSLARIAGVPDTELRIHDPAWPPPTELWLVMVPIRGLHPKQPIRVGTVTVVTDPKLTLIFSDAPEALRTMFRSTGVWAIAPVETATAFDAERQGSELIELALARIALVARYALSIGPSGATRSFEHTQLREGIASVPIVGAQTVQTERKWLREPRLMTDPLELDDRALASLETALAAKDRRLDFAIAAWRRATFAQDAPSAVVALAEALEFYVAEVSVPALFSDEERERIRHGIGPGWVQAQRERIEWILGLLNDASFGKRLAAALDADGVSLSAEEQRLLRTLREMRNDILHGRDRPTLVPDELRRALALVGRVLVFRAHRLASSTASTNGASLS